MDEDKRKIVKRKRNDLNAQNAYQYHRLEEAGFYFIPCRIEEKEEDVVFDYDMTGMHNVQELRTKEKAVRYGFLCQLIEAVKACPAFTFRITLDNLYFDAQGRLRIMERDLQQKGEDDSGERLSGVLALAGYLFQKKYSLADYLEGGIDLLGRQRSTAYLLDIEDMEQAYGIFVKRQEEEQKRLDEEYVCLKKNSYGSRNILLILMGMFILCFSVSGIYWYVEHVQPEQCALRAERAYLENDLIAVIEALSSIPVEKMDTHEKYVLAVSYIKAQVVDSFTNETKELLLSKLAYNSDEAVLDYWIYLGRRQVEPAIDIAMRRSDNQLLLYAYLQKLDVVADDAELTGEEKDAQLTELKSKVTALADAMGIDYKEDAEGN